MKTKILFFVALLGLGTLAMAQTDSPKKSIVSFGVKAGIDLNADINDLPSLPGQIEGVMKDNYMIGAFARLGNRLYLQPEAYYVVQNVEEDGVITSVGSVRVPVHAGLKLIDIGLVSIHITGGAMLPIPLNSTEPFAFDVEKLQYQVGVGVGVLGFITTDIRYTLAKDIPFAQQITDFTQNGGMVNVTVGIKF